MLETNTVYKTLCLSRAISYTFKTFVGSNPLSGKEKNAGAYALVSAEQRKVGPSSVCYLEGGLLPNKQPRILNKVLAKELNPIKRRRKP